MKASSVNEALERISICAGMTASRESPDREETQFLAHAKGIAGIIGRDGFFVAWAGKSVLEAFGRES